MPISNIQYSDDSMSRVLACTPACHACACKLQGDVFLVRHSLSFVTLDSGGDRDTSSRAFQFGQKKFRFDSILATKSIFFDLAI